MGIEVFELINSIENDLFHLFVFLLLIERKIAFSDFYHVQISLRKSKIIILFVVNLWILGSKHFRRVCEKGNFFELFEPDGEPYSIPLGHSLISFS